MITYSQPCLYGWSDGDTTPYAELNLRLLEDCSRRKHRERWKLCSFHAGRPSHASQELPRQIHRGTVSPPQPDKSTCTRSPPL